MVAKMSNKKTNKNIISRIFSVSWVSILIGVVILSVVIGIIEPSFVSIINFRNILLQASTISIIAVGMTLVIMSGGIDISVGMNVVFMMALMSELAKYMPAWLVLLIGVLGGAAVGFLNGFLVCTLQIVPMIATLSTMSLCRGAAYLIIASKMRSVDDSIRVIGQTQVFGVIPLPIIIMVVMVILGYFLLKYTRFGRYVLAVGNSLGSARDSGIPIHKVQFATYAICGFCAGIASLVYIGRLGTVQTDTITGLEFQVITAVVLGGTKLIGGRGTMIGGMIGAIFLLLIENALSMLGVSIFYYDVVRGGILFIAVTIDIVTYNRQIKNLTLERARRLRLGAPS